MMMMGILTDACPFRLQANISQDEWSRMTALYLERVAARQAAALAEGLTDGSAELHPRRQLYTFHNGGKRCNTNNPVPQHVWSRLTRRTSCALEGVRRGI